MGSLFFNWRIIALQYCVGFHHNIAWISHSYVYILTFWASLPSPIPPTTEHQPGLPVFYSSFPPVIWITHNSGLPWWLNYTWLWTSLIVQMVKKSACNARDPGSIPGVGRSPGEGNGNLLQYSCLENSMDRGVWWATVHGIAKSHTWLTNTHNVVLYICSTSSLSIHLLMNI